MLYYINKIQVSKYYANLNNLITTNKRGEFVSSEHLGESRIILNYLVPLVESLTDLHGLIKVSILKLI